MLPLHLLLSLLLTLFLARVTCFADAAHGALPLSSRTSAPSSPVASVFEAVLSHRHHHIAHNQGKRKKEKKALVKGVSLSHRSALQTMEDARFRSKTGFGGSVAAALPIVAGLPTSPLCRNPTYPLCENGCCPQGFSCKGGGATGENFCVQLSGRVPVNMVRPEAYKGHGKYEADIKKVTKDCCWPCTDRFVQSLQSEFIEITESGKEEALQRFHEWISRDAAGGASKTDAWRRQQRRRQHHGERIFAHVGSRDAPIAAGTMETSGPRFQELLSEQKARRRRVVGGGPEQMKGNEGLFSMGKLALKKHYGIVLDPKEPPPTKPDDPKPEPPPEPRIEPGEQVKGLVRCCDLCPEQFYLPADYDDGVSPYSLLELRDGGIGAEDDEVNDEEDGEEKEEGAGLGEKSTTGAGGDTKPDASAARTILHRRDSSDSSDSSDGAGGGRRKLLRNSEPPFDKHTLVEKGGVGCCMLCPSESMPHKFTSTQEQNRVFNKEVPFTMMLELDVQTKTGAENTQSQSQSAASGWASALPGKPPAGPPCCALCPWWALNPAYRPPGEAFGGIFGTNNPVRDGPWGPTRFRKGKMFP